MKNDLGKDGIRKLVWAIAIPSMIAQFVSVLYSIVDRMYIGHLAGIGVNALAGVGVCGPVVTMIGALASLVGVGGAPLASIAMGEGNNDNAGKIIGNAFDLMMIIAIAVVVLVYPFAGKMLYVFGASETTILYALSYFKIYLLGTPFLLLATGMNNFINCQGYARIGMISVLIGAVTNIILDPILMFVFHMGVEGAAMASVISQLFSCIFVMTVLLSKHLPVRLKFMGIDIKTCLNILKIGFTQFIIIAFDNVMIISMNAVLQKYGGEQLGDVLITVNTIVQSFMLVVTMPLGGISSGTQCILSYNYGAYQMDRIKEGIRYIAKVCIGYCVLMFAIAWLFGKYFIFLFNKDAQLVELAQNALKLVTLFIIPLGLQYEMVDSMTALGQVNISLPLSFFRKGVYFVALFLIPVFFSVQYTFAAECISDLIAPIVSFITVKKNLPLILEWRMSMKEEQKVTE